MHSTFPQWTSIKDQWRQIKGASDIQEKQKLLDSICSILANSLSSASSEELECAFGQPDYFGKFVAIRFVLLLFV